MSIVQASINSVSMMMGKYNVKVAFGADGLSIWIDPPGEAPALMLALVDVGQLQLVVRQFTERGIAVWEVPLQPKVDA